MIYCVKVCQTLVQEELSISMLVIDPAVSRNSNIRIPLASLNCRIRSRRLSRPFMSNLGDLKSKLANYLIFTD